MRIPIAMLFLGCSPMKVQEVPVPPDVGAKPAVDAATDASEADAAIDPPDAQSDDAAGDAGIGDAPSVGLIMIDVQEVFVDIAANRDLDAIIEEQRSLLGLGDERELPIFITYEASMSGDHALHAPLASAVPPEASQFVKTKFDATQLPALGRAIRDTGRSHWLVLGTESDVCVMQTVLGLRSMGLGVLLATDAIFSSEPNVSPALRRMEQAGAVLVARSQLEAALTDPPPSSGAQVRLEKPLSMGVLLNRFTDDTVDSTDPLAAEKAARLRELLIVSEWFELPVFATDLALPDDYADFYSGELRPIAELAGDASIEQLTIAGTDEDLIATVGTIDRQLFVMEDGLLARTGADLGALYSAGAVPTTYKAFYYGMTRSVDEREWPSQRWVDRAAIYFDRTLAPEDLPPMPYTP